MSQITESNSQDNLDESLVHIFLRGFFLPLRILGQGLAWLTHQPPLKQFGHILRRFFRLRIIRFIATILGLKFIHSSWSELKGVTWPKRREGLRLTSAVIFFSVIFALLLAAVDYGLDKLFKQLLLK